VLNIGYSILLTLLKEIKVCSQTKEKIMKKVCILSIIFFSLCLFLSAETPYVIVVSFDGFRYDYVDKTATPNFDYLKENGTKAASFQPIFPSKTFPNHYAIATGSYAQTHGLMGNHFYSTKHDEVYTMKDKTKVRDPKWYGAEPIWVTAERQGVKSGSYFWVGSEAPIHGYLPSILKYYDESVPFEARVDSVFAWLQLPEEERPHLIMLYFHEPDAAGHKFGPDNPELIPMIEYLDSILGKIITGIEDLEISDQVYLIVLSDHGMTEVGENQTIYLNDYISDPDAFHPYFGGPVVQLTLNEDYEEQETDIFLKLKTIPHIDLYTYDTIPERYHFKNMDTGDFVLVAHEGWILSTGEEPYSSKATHGYDPELRSMHGIFYALGPDIKTDHQIETFENIHVYPFICSLLEIEPYKNIFSGPDGKLEVLYEILER